jgi:hypothetical protein
MSMPLVSLREAADDFNAGKCQLRSDVEVRIGDDVARWVLVIDTEWACYDNHGRPMYRMLMHRADVTLGEPEWEPDVLTGAGPRDVDIIAAVFGIDPDARVWAKGSAYTKG